MATRLQATPGSGFGWPFEQIVSRHPRASDLRVNLEDASIRFQIEEKSIGFREDGAQVMRDLLTHCPEADLATGRLALGGGPCGPRSTYEEPTS